LNLYSKDRKKSKSSGPIKAKGAVKTTKEEKKLQFEADETSKEQAKKELNVLAQLIGTSKVETKDAVNINLFPDTSLSSGEGKVQVKTAEIITFGADDTSALKQKLEETFLDIGQQQQEADDDLLELMDKS